MHHLIPFLSSILPIIASSLVCLVVAINVYFKIRRNFAISVNCWFCNSWTKVPYDDRNSFNCPTCSQYNGFTKEGDYNKVIPQQHDELMNKLTLTKNTKTVSNGLCSLCNNNQRLKVFQLANFVPLVEDNYDAEIEHFQKQLDKAYKLCKKCDNILKKTLTKQNTLIFGNQIKNIYKKGFIKTIELKNIGSSKTIISGFLTTILVLAVVFTTLANMKLFTNRLSMLIPKEYFVIYKDIISKLNIKTMHVPYLEKKVKVDLYFLISGVGLLVQMMKTIWGKHFSANKANQLLCWVILFLISWVREYRYSLYVLPVEGFSCIYLLATAFNKERRKLEKTNGKAMRKLVRNLETTCSDFTESDFEDVSNSSTQSVPQLNSFTANNSFLSTKSCSTHFSTDLNKSLNNLNLGFKNTLTRPKPVLSPPKFQNVNSWVAGGYWKDSNGGLPTYQKTNLSRTSSESSGFCSQTNDLQFAKTGFCEFDRGSVVSDFVPGFKRTFFPNLQHNNMLYIQRVANPSLIRFSEPYARFDNWSDRVNAQALKGFGDLSLRSE